MGSVPSSFVLLWGFFPCLWVALPFMRWERNQPNRRNPKLKSTAKTVLSFVSPKRMKFYKERPCRVYIFIRLNGGLYYYVAMKGQ